ncbi:MAG TPA: CocE/NonD family hydrolase [Acidimicrobiales bacterium]|nr:CocE/NonD family hydrolase [Acidimicrobiales bacterium]
MPSIDDFLAMLPDGAPHPADWRLPPDTDHGGRRSSFHLTMRDGVRVALDVWVPPAAANGPVPTALRSTRYRRSVVDDAIADHVGPIGVGRWMRSGFALVEVDARGTGASFGVWPRPWDDDQRDDLYEICDWIVAQSWSDGTIGGFGTSYDGTTAHLLAATGHPAVKAVIPRFALFDAYGHIAAPGGVVLEWFLKTWSSGNDTLDGLSERADPAVAAMVTGRVRPVDGPDGDELLAQAQNEHASNWYLWGSIAEGDIDRERMVGSDGVSVEQGTPFGRVGALRENRVPMWVWSAWYDGAYAAAALAQLADLDLDVRVTIGPWSHGAVWTPLGSQYNRDAWLSPTTTEQQGLMAAFLRRHAVGDVADPSPARLRYYTLGAEEWREADQWPPHGVSMQDWHLNSDGRLDRRREDEGGADVYDVDWDATTGTQTRWHTLIGGPPIVYPDRREQDLRLLTWTSEPLRDAYEVTGTPAIELHVRSTATDGAFHVYLEEVSPDGTVTYLTEGELRARHRKLADGPPPYETFGPWHTHSVDDAEPLVPGEVAQLVFTLWPISVVVPAGHSLRLALAGADAGVFARVPAGGDVTIEVLRGPEYPSRVSLPTR